MTFKSDSIVYIQQYVHKLFLLNLLLKIFLKKKKKRLLKIVVMFYSLIQCFFHFIRGLHNIMYLESSVKGNHMVMGSKQKKLTFTDNKDLKKNYNPNIRVVFYNIRNKNIVMVFHNGL